MNAVMDEDNGIETDLVLMHGTCCDKLGIEWELRQQLIIEQMPLYGAAAVLSRNVATPP